MNGGAHRHSRLVVWVCVLCCIALSIFWRLIGSDGQAWRSVIGSDAEGYYAYLEGLIVQGDLAHVRTAPFHFAPAGDGQVIKYFCGTALLEAPTVIVAHITAYVCGVADGRSLPYALAIVLSALCMCAFGLLRLRSLLLALGVRDAVVAWTLVVLFFGTGLPYYTVMTPGMSHVYGFGMLAWVFDRARAAWCMPSARSLVITATAIALLTLVRPTDLPGLAAMPVVAIGSGITLRTWLRSVPRTAVLIAVLVATAVLSLQPLLWHAQCGRWFVPPYADEGFLWGRPMLWSLLFGARKGLFFYWPLLLLVLPGLVLLFRRSRMAATSTLLALGACAYVVGCWWIWYYGYSYGSRPFIDLLPLFAFPIALVMERAFDRSRHLCAWVITPLLLLQCFQLWQYNMGIIHPYNMDREKYGLIFLRTDERWRGAFGGAGQVPPFAPYGLGQVAALDTAVAHVVVTLDSARAFSPLLAIAPGTLPTGKPLHVEARLSIKALRIGSAKNADLVCSYHHDGKDRLHLSWPIEDLPRMDDRTWRPWRYRITLPAPAPGDELRCYVRLHGPGSVVLRDLRMKVLVPNPVR